MLQTIILLSSWSLEKEMLREPVFGECQIYTTNIYHGKLVLY